MSNFDILNELIMFVSLTDIGKADNAAIVSDNIIQKHAGEAVSQLEGLKTSGAIKTDEELDSLYRIAFFISKASRGEEITREEFLAVNTGNTIITSVERLNKIAPPIGA